MYDRERGDYRNKQTAVFSRQYCGSIVNPHAVDILLFFIIYFMRFGEINYKIQTLTFTRNTVKFLFLTMSGQIAERLI